MPLKRMAESGLIVWYNDYVNATKPFYLFRQPSTSVVLPLMVSLGTNI